MVKSDSILERMTEYFNNNGFPVIVRRLSKGYSIVNEYGEPLARFRPAPGNQDRVEVLWWKYSGKWGHIGDFGGLFMDLEKALAYVLSDPTGIFWKGKIDFFPR